MKQGFVARFERKVLFRITRWLALALSLLLFLALIGAGLMMLGTLTSGLRKPEPADSVTLASNDSTSTTQSPASAGTLSTAPANALHGVRMPPALQEIFLTEQNRNALSGWLDSIEANERQDFVDALGEAADAATAAETDPTDAINDYRQRYQAYVAERDADEAIAMAKRLQILAAIGSALALIGLFSLVLVLMAIERNTRNTATQDAWS